MWGIITILNSVKAKRKWSTQQHIANSLDQLAQLIDEYYHATWSGEIIIRSKNRHQSRGVYSAYGTHAWHAYMSRKPHYGAVLPFDVGPTGEVLTKNILLIKNNYKVKSERELYRDAKSIAMHLDCKVKII